MRAVLLLSLLVLAGCSHAGQPNQESSSQDEAKGALDDLGFMRRLLGQESVSDEPDLAVPKTEDTEESEEEKKAD
jgi:hypothetical protein